MISYISTYFIVLFEVFGFFIILRKSVHASKSSVTFTRIALILLVINTILFHLESWTQTFETLSPMRPVLAYTIYLMQPLILITSMFITSPPEKSDVWILIPEIVCIPLYFTSPSTHLVCWYADTNNYKGGPLSDLPYIIFAFYLVIFVVRCIVKAQIKFNRLGNAAAVIGIVGFAVVGVILYVTLDISNDYSAIFTTALLLYYLNYYINLSRIDPLTRLYNRQSLYRDMQFPIKPVTAVASVDMNDLKLINDTSGHKAGDKALRTIAGCLASNGRIKSVYRIGGDEFIIFYFSKDYKEIENDVASMRNRLAETPYVCAFGYAAVHDAASLSDALSEADMLMYKDKAELKKKTAGE